LPFQNISEDPEQEYFSNGVANDIITELSRNRWLLVIASNSSFIYKRRVVDVKQVARELGVRYVLEGSVRRARERVRVSTRLIDAETGGHIWAERYDRDLTDVFAVQDEVTLAVTRAIGPAVVNAETQRALRKPPGNLRAWEACQRGLWHAWQRRLEDVPRAREFFNRALELDPSFAPAHRGLAVLYTMEGIFFGSRPLSEALALADDQASRAVELDPTDANSHVTRAFGSGNAGNLARGFEHVERALAINPNCAPAYFAKGWLLMFSGQPAEGREAILFSFRLDPRSASDVTARCNVAMTYYFERDYENAVAAARHLVADRPDHPWAYRYLAAALGQLGRAHEALDALNRALAVAPDMFHLYVRQRMPYMRQPDYEHVLDGLRKAGWNG
jgi:adenylate cyclase